MALPTSRDIRFPVCWDHKARRASERECESLHWKSPPLEKLEIDVSAPFRSSSAPFRSDGLILESLDILKQRLMMAKGEMEMSEGIPGSLSERYTYYGTYPRMTMQPRL